MKLIAVGKRYETRDGRTTSRIEGTDDLEYPYKAKLGESDESWTEEGKYDVYSEFASPFDLVGEVIDSKPKLSNAEELMIDIYNSLQGLEDEYARGMATGISLSLDIVRKTK